MSGAPATLTPGEERVLHHARAFRHAPWMRRTLLGLNVLALALFGWLAWSIHGALGLERALMITFPLVLVTQFLLVWTDLFLRQWATALALIRKLSP